jgi:hypothetical protein
LGQWPVRNELKCFKLTDADDRNKVMTISHLDNWRG